MEKQEHGGNNKSYEYSDQLFISSSDVELAQYFLSLLEEKNLGKVFSGKLDQSLVQYLVEKIMSMSIGDNGLKNYFSNNWTLDSKNLAYRTVFFLPRLVTLLIGMQTALGNGDFYWLEKATGYSMNKYDKKMLEKTGEMVPIVSTVGYVVENNSVDKGEKPLMKILDDFEDVVHITTWLFYNKTRFLRTIGGEGKGNLFYKEIYVRMAKSVLQTSTQLLSKIKKEIKKTLETEQKQVLLPPFNNTDPQQLLKLLENNEETEAPLNARMNKEDYLLVMVIAYYSALLITTYVQFLVSMDNKNSSLLAKTNILTINLYKENKEFFSALKETKYAKSIATAGSVTDKNITAFTGRSISNYSLARLIGMLTSNEWILDKFPLLTLVNQKYLDVETVVQFFDSVLEDAVNRLKYNSLVSTQEIFLLDIIISNLASVYYRDINNLSISGQNISNDELMFITHILTRLSIVKSDTNKVLIGYYVKGGKHVSKKIVFMHFLTFWKMNFHSINKDIASLTVAHYFLKRAEIIKKENRELYEYLEKTSNITKHIDSLLIIVTGENEVETVYSELVILDLLWIYNQARKIRSNQHVIPFIDVPLILSNIGIIANMIDKSFVPLVNKKNYEMFSVLEETFKDFLEDPPSVSGGLFTLENQLLLLMTLLTVGRNSYVEETIIDIIGNSEVSIKDVINTYDFTKEHGGQEKRNAILSKAIAVYLLLVFVMYYLEKNYLPVLLNNEKTRITEKDRRVVSKVKHILKDIEDYLSEHLDVANFLVMGFIEPTNIYYLSLTTFISREIGLKLNQLDKIRERAISIV